VTWPRKTMPQQAYVDVVFAISSLLLI
jgi:hypothetical protein